MSVAEARPLELLYEGSVKRVFRAPDKPDRLWFEFTDDYSVFDWGKMPDTIANKGRALALMGAFIFDRLVKPNFWQSLPDSPHLQKFDQEWLDKRFSHPVFSGAQGLALAGAPTHFKALTQLRGRVTDLIGAVSAPEPLFMEVLAADVNRPALQKILHHSLYLYPELTAQARARRRLVPLEIVFRFGMPQGSSLSERLARDPGYAQVLGAQIPKAGSYFNHPVIEFYTKLEAKDRLLTWQEAIALSNLSGAEFEALVELSLDTALALHAIFGDRQIELWDGKIELLAEAGKLLIADSIGPDELRLMHQGCHLSKEMIRQIYRGSPWETAIKQAQLIAREDNSRSWKQIAVQDLHAAPDPLPATFKPLVDRLYGVIANHLLGGEIFKEHPSLDGFVRSLPAYLVSDASQVSAGDAAVVQREVIEE